MTKNSHDQFATQTCLQNNLMEVILHCGSSSKIFLVYVNLTGKTKTK